MALEPGNPPPVTQYAIGFCIYAQKNPATFLCLLCSYYIFGLPLYCFPLLCPYQHREQCCGAYGYTHYYKILGKNVVMGNRDAAYRAGRSSAKR